MPPGKGQWLTAQHSLDCQPGDASQCPTATNPSTSAPLLASPLPHTQAPRCDRCAQGPHLTSRTCFLLDLSLPAQARVAPRSSRVCSGVVRVLGCRCWSKGMRVAPAAPTYRGRGRRGPGGFPPSREAGAVTVPSRGAAVSLQEQGNRCRDGGPGQQPGGSQVLEPLSAHGTSPALPGDPRGPQL